MNYRFAVLTLVALTLYVAPNCLAQTTTPLPFGASALAFETDGTLFVFGGGGASSILSIASDGTQSTINLQTGTSLDSLGGAAFDSSTGRLLVTDNELFGDGVGSLFSIDVASGQVDTLVSGFDFIDDVAVRSTGEVFFSTADGGGLGGVYQAFSDGSATQVVGGLDFGAGLAFDVNDDLVFQDVNEIDFLGTVSRLSITETGSGLSFGGTEVLATSLSGGFDLAADSEGDLFVTGSGGLFELDRDASGAFLGTATNLIAGSFATEAAFSSPEITFIPDFGASELISLTVVAVPEPTTLGLTGILALGLTIRRRRLTC